MSDGDDYDWKDEYPKFHSSQTKTLKKNGVPFDISTIKNTKMSKAKLEMFRFIIAKNTQSVFEVGFGYGNNLISIKNMIPNISINGCDISQKQYKEAIKMYPSLESENLKVYDFVKEDTNGKFDIVFSNAVVMHLSENRARKAIEKMCKISNRYIFCCDGKLKYKIKDLDTFLPKFGKVTFLKDIWKQADNQPFYIEVNK